MDCYCDYEMPSVYSKETRRARKEHKCVECGCIIKPGEQYEYMFGIWWNERSQAKTCQRCLDLREFVETNVPCFCWAHYNLHEDALETARGYGYEVIGSGLLFGTYRRKLIADRHATESKK